MSRLIPAEAIPITYRAQGEIKPSPLESNVIRTNEEPTVNIIFNPLERSLTLSDRVREVFEQNLKKSNIPATYPSFFCLPRSSARLSGGRN